MRPPRNCRKAISIYTRRVKHEEECFIWNLNEHTVIVKTMHYINDSSVQNVPPCQCSILLSLRQRYSYLDKDLTLEHNSPKSLQDKISIYDWVNNVIPRQFMNYLYVWQISWSTYCIVRARKRQQPTFSYFFWNAAPVQNMSRKQNKATFIRVEGQDGKRWKSAHKVDSALRDMLIIF